ncbi:energy transducer TonB [Candidatus Protochlamydia amoebophila]|uniref:energy transducer TonB n=1 Tax=Candidatus Protochlamydia amoebophila TaxID=362787 RepID=UPI001BC95C02|nr:hypothetical protein [Candidatus Protochlamydia amoebophila]
MHNDPTSLFFQTYTQQKAWWLIAIAVIFFHLLILLVNSTWSISSEKQQTTKLVVSTLILQPSAPSSSIKTLLTQEIDKSLISSTSLPLTSVTPENPLPAKTKPKDSSKSHKVTEKKSELKLESNLSPKTEPKKNTASSPKIKKADPPQKTTVQKQAEKKRVKATPASTFEKEKQKKEAVKKENIAKEILAKDADKRLKQELAASQEAALKKEQQLLANAKENLAKIGEAKQKSKSTTLTKIEESPSLKQVQNLQIDTLPQGNSVQGGLNGRDSSYRDEIAQRLKLFLKLPDYGSVQVKLTIDRTGKITQISIVKSESSKNQQYIEKNLPTIYFPAFGTRFEGLSQYTFLVTLNNDY